MKRKEMRSRVRLATKVIVLTVPGEPEPEVYLVCSDVFGILGKILVTNQLSSSFGNGPRFAYDEVRFLLRLLGSPYAVTGKQELHSVDLWISGG